jgi:homoserine dehydrogenase
LGSVGRGVYEHLRRLDDLVEIEQVAVRDPEKHEAEGIPAELLTTDPVAAASSGVDLVIETMGGVETAGAALQAALLNGAHVVTANKALLADAGDDLRRLAVSQGCLLRYSAAVGGSMPLLERIRARAGCRLLTLRAALNGTTHFVLDRVICGEDFAHAVGEAQSLGLAESNPSRDLSGQDAADKLAVAAAEAGFPDLSAEDVRREPLTSRAIRNAHLSGTRGQVIRSVASLRLNHERIEAHVGLCGLDGDDPLASIPVDYCGAVLQWQDGSSELLCGKGAGRWPTAEAVVADVLEILRTVSTHRAPEQLEPAGVAAG